MPPLWALVGMGWGGSLRKRTLCQGLGRRDESQGAVPSVTASLPGAAQKRVPPTRMMPPYNHVALYQHCQGQEGKWGGEGGCSTLLTSQPWL